MSEKKTMADNAVAIEDKEKKKFISKEWCEILNDPPKVPRRKRTRVDYFDCNCDEKPKFKAPKTAAMANADDPGAAEAAAMVNGDDPGAEIANRDVPGPAEAAAMVNGGDPVAVMVNGDDPDAAEAAAMVNGGDPGAVMANGDDPGAKSPAVMVNGGDPGTVMVNGDDPGRELPAAMANGGDPGAEIGNGGDPGAELPPAAAVAVAVAVENGDDPEIPAAMRAHIIEMGGYGIRLIIEKVLTATDMRTDQGRLSLPPKQLRAEFLTAEEERFLVRRGGEGDPGLNFIDTIILGPDLRESAIRFKKWRIGAKYANCLMNKWNAFARANHLRPGNTVRLWTFRVDRFHPRTNTINSELCFALDKF